MNLSAVYCGFNVGRFRRDYEVSHEVICREFGWGNDIKIILFVGCLDLPTDGSVNQKNPEFALEVMKECILRDPSIRCLMVGGGASFKGKLMDRIRNCSLEEKIRFTVVRLDIARLMVGSDLFLFPSLAEGLGMVAVEAQAAGLRVLTSDTTPRKCVVVPEMVMFNSISTGPVVWADKVLNLINLPRPNQVRCNTAVKTSPFSIENSAGELLKMYSLN